MSKNYGLIKGLYDAGAWTIQRVNSVVGKTLGITAEEYYQIIGYVYPNIGE